MSGPSRSRAAAPREQIGVANRRLGGDELLDLLGLRSRRDVENVDPEAVVHKASSRYYDELAERLTPPRSDGPGASTRAERATSTRDPAALARALRDESVTTCAHIARNGTGNRSRRPRLLRAVHRGHERRATSSTLYCGECEDSLVAKGLVDPERAPALAPPRVSARGPARVSARTETEPASEEEEGFSEETERMLKARRRSRLALLEAQLALVKRMEGRDTAESDAESNAARTTPAREQPGEVPEPKDSERAEPEGAVSTHTPRRAGTRRKPRTPIASPGADRMHDALVAGSMSDTSLLADIERLMRMSSSADAAPATPGEVYELSPSPSR